MKPVLVLYQQLQFEIGARDWLNRQEVRLIREIASGHVHGLVNYSSIIWVDCVMQ